MFSLIYELYLWFFSENVLIFIIKQINYKMLDVVEYSVALENKPKVERKQIVSIGTQIMFYRISNHIFLPMNV